MVRLISYLIGAGGSVMVWVHTGWVRKKLLFDRNTLQHAIFMGLSFVLPPSNLTSGSSVRGYLANKWNLHVRSQGLKILTLIEKNSKIKITYHCHYDKN